MKTYREFKIWKNVSDEQWTDWKWQISHCISTLGELSEIVDLSPQEYEGVEKATKALKMRISPHIALMMANGDKEDTLRCQFVPSINEVKTADIDILYKDVNDDDGYSPVKGLVHRYPSKVLVFPSNFCGCYCRYCFRRNILQFPALTLCNSANGGKALIFRRFRHLPFGRVIRISRRIPA